MAGYLENIVGRRCWIKGTDKSAYNGVRSRNIQCIKND